MTQVSQNGWAVHDTTSGLILFAAAGRNWYAPNSDVVVVARELLTRFNAEVESVTENDRVVDDWSWAKRNIRGSSTAISNHSSATAWDVNATKHPRSVHGTFSSTKIAAVHRILASITDNAGNRIFRWGNDYVNATIDAMHFEIVRSHASVKEAADKIRARQKKESEVELNDKVKLTKAAAEAMSQPGYTTHKEGDEVTVSYLLQWGGAGEYRSAGKLDKLVTQNATLVAQLKALTAAVTALAANSPKGVQEAFSAGVAEMNAASEQQA